MLRLSTFCLSLLFLASCTEKHNWYQKEFSAEEKPALAESVRNGVSYHYQGTVPEQFHALEALALDSSNGDFWREMGTSRVKRSLADEMYYWYGKAAELKPDPWMGFRGYLYLYFYRDYPRAIADFDQMDSIIGGIGNSQAQDHDYMRGIAYYGLKDYQSSKDYLRKYIERISTEVGAEWVDVYAHLYLFFCHKVLGEEMAMQNELNAIFALYPDLADAHYQQALIYHQKNQLKAARESLEKARASYDLGFYHQRPYVEVLEQIYPQDLEALASLLTK